MKKIFVFLILVLFMIFLIEIYFEIIYPSYLSVANSCGIISDEELNESGYVVTGEYNPSNDTITIYYNSSGVNRHENCHKVQNSKNNLHSCSNKFFRFGDEMECYISEHLPDKIYDKIYMK